MNRPKLTAANSAFLASMKAAYNTKIYRLMSQGLNDALTPTGMNAIIAQVRHCVTRDDAQRFAELMHSHHAQPAPTDTDRPVPLAIQAMERDAAKAKLTPVDAKVAELLARYFSEIETFEERGLDSLDFKEVNVATLKGAIEAAFAAGRDFEAARIAKRDHGGCRYVGTEPAPCRLCGKSKGAH